MRNYFDAQNMSCKISHFCKHSPVRWLVLFSILSVLGILMARWLDPVIYMDGVFYLSLMDLCRSNDSFVAGQDSSRIFLTTPLPFFLAHIFSKGGLSTESAWLLINILCGAALPTIIYHISQIVQKDLRVSLAASFLIACNPSLLQLFAELQREPLYIFCGSLVMLYILGGLVKNSAKRWCAAGFFLACMCLTRVEGCEFFIIAILGVLIYGIMQGHRWAQLLLNYGIMLGACLLSFVLILYIIRVPISFFQLYFFRLSMHFDRLFDFVKFMIGL